MVFTSNRGRGAIEPVSGTSKKKDRSPKNSLDSRVEGMGMGPLPFLGTTIDPGVHVPFQNHLQEGLANPPHVAAPPTAAPVSLHPQGKVETIRSELGRIDTQYKTLVGLDEVPLPPEIKAQVDAMKQQTKAEIDAINEQIIQLENDFAARQANFEQGTQWLEALGQTATVDRSNPAVAAVQQAIETGEGLDEAISGLASSGLDLEGMTEAVGREQYQLEMELQLRNSVHNLVQNRKDLQRGMVQAEQALKDSGEAARFNTFLISGDPTPQGRLDETFLAGVDAYLSSTGLELTPQQEDALAAQLLPIAQAMPPDGFDNPEVQTAIGEIATAFQLSPGDLLSQAKYAYERGLSARLEAESAGLQTSLKPGSIGLSTVAYTAAAPLLGEYLDEEGLRNLAASPALHEIIRLKSRGNTAWKGGGTQSGLGGLSADTYKELGYDPEEVAQDSGLAMAALLEFIAAKYGVGPDMAAYALQDFISNPEDWGEF